MSEREVGNDTYLKMGEMPVQPDISVKEFCALKNYKIICNQLPCISLRITSKLTKG